MKPMPTLALMLLVGSSCSKTEPDPLVPSFVVVAPVPPPKPERRPFKGLIDALDTCSEDEQKRFLSNLAEGLRSESMARFSRDQAPHWGDLVQELFVRGKLSVVHHLLRDGSLKWTHLSELASAAGRRGDRISFVILLDILDEPEARDQRTGRLEQSIRPSAVLRGVGDYLAHSWSEPRAYTRLVEILQGRSDPVLRGLAASSLGDSKRPEVEFVLVRALEDHAELSLDDNRSADDIDTVASRAEESLKRIRKPGGTLQ